MSGEPDRVSAEMITSYTKMHLGLQQQWDERYFNAVKLRTLLLSADAILTWAFILWVGFAMVVVTLYGYSPTRYPLYVEFGYSLAVFFVYYALVGFARRQTEAYIVKLRAQRVGVLEKDLKRPFSETEDPPLARFAFGLRKTFRIPRRGLGQYMVVLFQFLAGSVYVLNYALHILWNGDVRTLQQPTLLWFFHAVVTGGGLLIIIKYGGFLVDTKRLLTAIEGLVGSVFGGVTTHTTVQTRVEEKANKQTCNSVPSDNKQDEK